MRFAILFGAVLISASIEHLSGREWILPKQVESFCVMVLCLFIIMDIIEYFRKF
jgi:hypothetical protein